VCLSEDAGRTDSRLDSNDDCSLYIQPKSLVGKHRHVTVRQFVVTRLLHLQSRIDSQQPGLNFIEPLSPNVVVFRLSLSRAIVLDDYVRLTTRVVKTANAAEPTNQPLTSFNISSAFDTASVIAILESAASCLGNIEQRRYCEHYYSVHLDGLGHERLHTWEEYAVARETFRRPTQHFLDNLM
jgi:hypothetical protein